MRRLILTLALILASAVPVAAHDETPYETYLEGLLTASQTIGEELLANDEDMADSRAVLLALQLETVPAECYVPLYVAQWLTYADLVAIAEARSTRESVRAVDRLTTGLSTANAMLIPTAEACFDSE